jgi:hypothetical protein
MIERIINGCPICGSDVKGDQQHKYYCSYCNMLFRKKQLYLSKEHIVAHTKKTILKTMDKRLIKKLHV